MFCVNYCVSLIAFIYWEMLLAKISPAYRTFTYFKHWKDLKSVLHKMSLAWRLTRSKRWKQLFKVWPFSCGPNLQVDDANAVGDERNSLHPVVSQQQVPQLAHFLVQIQIIAQVSFVLGYCLFEHILWQCFCVFLWEWFGFVPLSEGVSLLVLKVKHVTLWLGTLKALALTPLVWRRFLLALKYISLSGSMGRLTSLFSERFRSSRRASLEKAPSSISEILFPVRSILFRVTVDRWGGGHDETMFGFALSKSQGFKWSMLKSLSCIWGLVHFGVHYMMIWRLCLVLQIIVVVSWYFLSEVFLKPQLLINS